MIRDHGVDAVLTVVVHRQELIDLLGAYDGADGLLVGIQNLDGQRIGAAEHGEYGEDCFEVSVAIGREGIVIRIGHTLVAHTGKHTVGGKRGGEQVILRKDALVGIHGFVDDVLRGKPVAVEAHHGQTEALAAITGQGDEALHEVVLLRARAADTCGDLHCAARRNGDGALAVGDRAADERDRRKLVLTLDHVGIEGIGSEGVGGGLRAVVGKRDHKAGRLTNFTEGCTAEAIDRRKHARLRSARRIDHTGTLLAHGVGCAVRSIEGISRIHQRELDVLRHVELAEGKLACGNGIMHRADHQRRRAGDIGRCHTRAAHHLVAAAGGDGVDVAAGSGNFGLDIQGGCRAPAGEGTHLAAVGGCNKLILQVAEADLRTGRCQLNQLKTEVVADHDLVALPGRGGCILGADIEGDFIARNIIIDNDRACAEVIAVIHLLLEGNVAALHNRDPLAKLTAENNTEHLKELVHRAVATVQKRHILQEIPAVVIRHFGVKHIIFRGEIVGNRIVGSVTGCHRDRRALDIVVIDRGNRESRGGGTRRGDRTGIHEAEVVGVDAKQRGARAVVTGGYAAQDTCLRSLLKGKLQEVHIVIEAGGAAEGEVHHIRAELHGILHRTQNVIRIGGAGHAKDLQAENLRIGCNARDAVLPAVAGRDTGDMQTVR